MYFTIEELVPENSESPKERQKSWQQCLAKISNTIKISALRSISFIQGWFGSQIRQLSIRGEVILMVLCVGGISGAILLIHFYIDRSELFLQMENEKEILQLSREYRLLQQELAGVRIDVEKSILYHAGSNLLGLNTLLIAITEYFRREIYFTHLNKSPQSLFFDITGSALNFGLLLQLESFLQEQCISVNYSVNIREDQRTDFKLSLNPIESCSI